MEDMGLDLVGVENGAEWRRRTRVADPPLLRDPQPEGEIETCVQIATNLLVSYKSKFIKT